ncbi:PEFG-CTERM sorting domain-containing protein [Nitrosopumilus sp.]|nr:PEFG-CTERM sorting domain-containing protein [Nitrosopumilus sp.]MDB4850058.1 PEFG-CTERM sorting domain-containing protein [Nitrosopumilus sp.]
MKTKAISSIFVLFAIAAGMASMAPAAYADHAEVAIGAVEESGFSQSCVETGCYTPMVATVDVGGVVTMTNTDPTGVHTFTSGTVNGFTPSPDGTFDTGVLMSGDAFEWSPTETGTVPYYCMLHTWMVGEIIVQEVAAEEHADDHGDDHGDMEMSHSDEPIMVEISSNTADAGEMLAIDLTFTTMSGEGVEHINYNILATQNGEVVLEANDVHDHDGINDHMTAPLPAATSDDTPVEVEVIFNGYGLPDGEKTGPIGQVTTMQVVPEFGTIAMMILAVAIISIVAVTAKSRVVPRF